MILQIAEFRIATDRHPDFEAAMEELKTVIGSSRVYLGHTIQRCLETNGRYVLLHRSRRTRLVFAVQQCSRCGRHGWGRTATAR